MADRKWQFWVDRGGTFTDVIARAPDGATITKKLLSENPGFYTDATVAAMREITGVATGPLPPAELRIGTTVATNAPARDHARIWRCAAHWLSGAA
jgi:5-oxoprolinase (ATP-hydrolysing)